MVALEITLFAAESIRHLLAYTVFRAGAASPATVTLFAELCKLCVALSVYAPANSPTDVAIAPTPTINVFSAEFIRCAVPGTLHAIGEMVYLAALHFAPPGAILAASLVKLPATEFLRFCIGRRQRLNSCAGASLVLLMIGVLVFATSGLFYNVPRWYIAPLSGMFIGCTSAFARVFMEEYIVPISLNEDEKSLSMQLGLYTWGSLTSLVAVGLYQVFKIYSTTEVAYGYGFAPIHGPRHHVPKGAEKYAHYSREVLVLTMTMCGLMKSEIEGGLSSKLSVKAAILLTLLIAQVLLFQDCATRLLSLTPITIAGIGMVFVALWCYSYYRNLGNGIMIGDNDGFELQSLIQIDDFKLKPRDLEHMQLITTHEEDDQEVDEDDLDDPFGSKEVDWIWWRPDATKVFIALCSVAFITYETARL